MKQKTELTFSIQNNQKRAVFLQVFISYNLRQKKAKKPSKNSKRQKTATKKHVKPL